MNYDFSLISINLVAQLGYVDHTASDIALIEHMNMLVVAEVVMRKQPEHLRDYFLERLRHYRDVSISLPKASDLCYIKNEEVK
ncbi:TPA: DNA polymerase III subunit theta [Enterobacter hormaechei]|uniref:DNA polymerase III subunit theta n=1 Tax=Enterobacter cloacae complex TaxID=354276 RepID=UPI0010BE86B0|nr:DNA polymerase III subunit theta [Enterobacter hormaechei]MCU3754655.1 DNA polymerase III subunit theta [Enterobacter hormaechei subsp. hoffmannii]MCE1568083.1 DNA polymerase III subunit theta [Enterobacter hormaechei]MCM7250221.1 DNA polymerase III subunit theta [Enterobacter hormaechei]MCM7312737.1 DNA polymerase III subunit theta [Enterobacter hormaechei]MCM8177428.1 DNA polymerase III subunit theta [Enterobacter hormaechei]